MFDRWIEDEGPTTEQVNRDSEPGWITVETKEQFEAAKLDGCDFRSFGSYGWTYYKSDINSIWNGVILVQFRPNNVRNA